jgi:uncharacterized protein (TIGR03067 family)
MKPHLTIRTLFWLPLAVALGCAPATPDNLQGTWHGQSGIGQAAELRFGPGSAMRVEVGGDVGEGTYRVDWTKSPPHLDLTYKTGKVVQTLVDIAGDTLTLQNNEPGKPRPAQFDNDAVKLTRG